MAGTRFYNRPTRMRRRVYDPFMRMLIMRTGFSGFGSDRVQVLAVRGRRTGRWYRHPVGICTRDDQRYVISFYGESEWVRNLRAGTDAELHARKYREPIRATELRDEEHTEFLRFLLRRYPVIVWVWWKVRAKSATDEDVAVLAARYPVFHIEPKPS